MSGRMYALSLDSELELQFVATTLKHATTAPAIVWITISPEAYLAAPIPVSTEINKALASERLSLYSANFDVADNICLDTLMELDTLGAIAGSLIIVSCVDRFIEAADPDRWQYNITAWKAWAEKCDFAVLWLYSHKLNAQTHQADLLRLAHQFSGYARLRRIHETARYDIYYWFSPDGILVNKSFRLGLNKQEDWYALERETLLTEGAEPAIDEDDVFIMRSALPEGRPAPNDWRIFETQEQMLQALSSAHACTVIFHYHVGTPIDTLAHILFELRRMAGPYLKIAVKKSGGRIRQNNELLLLNVGANILIPAETGFARMLTQLKSIQGQVFSRPLPRDFDIAATNIKTGAPMGYLSPSEFAKAIAELTNATSSLINHNALIRLFLSPGVSVFEALRSCTMRRAGDVFTADDRSLYVFLASCEAEDIAATLDSVFRLPVAVIFSEETRYLSSDDINTIVSGLLRLNEQEHYDDYSQGLAQSSQIEQQVQDRSAKPSAQSRALRRPYTSVHHTIGLRVQPAQGEM